MFFHRICVFIDFTSINSLSAASLNAIPLSCISMNNQECKVRSQIVNVNSEDPVLFFTFNIKINKCSGSCKNINNPHAKLCVTDIVKNLYARVFNLMSRMT